MSLKVKVVYGNKNVKDQVTLSTITRNQTSKYNDNCLKEATYDNYRNGIKNRLRYARFPYKKYI